MEQNPYSFDSAIAHPGLTANNSQVEEIRKKFLSHEASIKSLGILYLLGGFFGLIFSFGWIIVGVATLAGVGNNSNDAQVAGFVLLILGSVVLAITILQLWSGIGVRRLNPPARIGAGVIAAIGLLGFPLGTLISAYFLYLLFSQKGAYIFSPEYKEIIAQTPHIKYKTSIIVWILLFLFLFVVFASIASLLLGGRR